ncbi:MAG TPA: LLM class F420-dependent oxidoreductase [Ktedonobacteraceae bacterium]|nr:LLM class F420-dependent oxidoreductase [Ktedonobacteraceae bacterium]
MTMKYGVIVPQGWRMDLVGISDPIEAAETMIRVAHTVEDLGYDAVWLFDHFHTVPVPTQEVTLECWMSTAALARETQRVRIGQIVTCNGYRNPALLAKMASTVDVLSHGRLDFGIGAGWYEHEYRAFGYDYPDAPTRLRYLREAVQIILKMWSDEEAVFEGKYYQIRGAINQPKGVQKPHIPMLIGGGGEKVTLKLVAQYGDACNVGNLEPEGIAHKFAILREHCAAVGRDYESINRTVMLNCSIARTDEEALERARAVNFARNTGGAEYLQTRALVGSPATIRQRLVEYEQVGSQEVILFFPQPQREEALRLFAEEILGK